MRSLISAMAFTMLLALPAEAPPAKADADCRTLHWQMIALLEEAGAAMQVLARIALEAEGISADTAHRISERLLDPSAATLEASAHRIEYQRHYAAFEAARRAVIDASGCD